MIEEEARGVFDRMLRNRDARWGDQDAFREALWHVGGRARCHFTSHFRRSAAQSARHPSAGPSCASTSCLINHDQSEHAAFAAQLDRRLSCWGTASAPGAAVVWPTNPRWRRAS